jgi:hypothetical protein
MPLMRRAGTLPLGTLLAAAAAGVAAVAVMGAVGPVAEAVAVAAGVVLNVACLWGICCWC